jgi:hypothetical protein
MELRSESKYEYKEPLVLIKTENPRKVTWV